MLPVTASTASDTLAGDGLTPLGADIRFLGDLARSFGHSAGFSFDAQHECFVSTRTSEQFVQDVHRQALRLARKHGAACVEDVCDVLRDSAHALRPEAVSRLLRTRADIRWLDEGQSWFCKRETRDNALLRNVCKVIAIAGRVRAAELRGGVARNYSLREVVPPKAILLRLCECDSRLTVDNDSVAAREGVVLDAALSTAERTLARVLRSNALVMERSTLERACVATGLSRPSFQAALTYSPIVIRYAPQVYGLRGVAIPPGAVESVTPLGKAQKGRLVLDSGWTSDGRVRLVYRLSEACVSSGIVAIPSPFAPFLQRDFSLLRLGNTLGTLRCRGTQAWGLAPLFRRLGAAAGGTLTIEFDLQMSGAEASLTDDAEESTSSLLLDGDLV